MKHAYLYCFNFLAVTSILCIAIYTIKDDFLATGDQVADNKIKIAIVSCGDESRLNSITLIKSVVMFTERQVDFFIITENDNNPKFSEQFAKWPIFFREKFSFTFIRPNFPNDEIDWQFMFKKCSAQRIFLPNVLNSVDSVLYLDADTLLLDSVEPLWEHLKLFSLNQKIGMAPSVQSENFSLYPGKVNYSFYGEFGLQAGVILMNLTRLREFKLYERLVPIHQQHLNEIKYGDQCLMNLLFNKHSDQVYDINCSWNFMHFDCNNKSKCRLQDNRIRLLHGMSEAFNSLSRNAPEFMIVHELFRSYDFNPTRNLFSEIEILLKKAKNFRTECGKMRESFLTSLHQAFKKHAEMIKKTL